MNGDEIFKLLLSAAAGAVASLVTVRTKFAIIDARFDSEKQLAATLREHDKAMLEKAFEQMRAEMREHHRTERQRARALGRRQRVMLELVADVANSMGIKHRALGVDAMVRSFTEEATEEASD